ncbi:MAG TPA: helix-turn-helix domain-containing protein [Bryobacteraceae bacterium]|nr:helix-turn-helix domain-containing protein [Bryobacteraceae bacterium]
MVAELDTPRGQPKGDKRDRTRAKLLEAARSLIREKGFEHTTLDAIAERAGMTTGAIYGNFKNRDELFLALGQTYWAPIKPNVRPQATFPEIMRSLADATLAVMPDRNAAAVGRLTGMSYALTHEEFRAKVTEFTAQSYAFGEEWLRSVTREEDLPMPAGQLVRVIHALSEGLVFQRLLTPELMPDEVFRAAFAALAGGGKHPAQ